MNRKNHCTSKGNIVLSKYRRKIIIFSCQSLKHKMTVLKREQGMICTQCLFVQIGFNPCCNGCPSQNVNYSPALCFIRFSLIFDNVTYILITISTLNDSIVDPTPLMGAFLFLNLCLSIVQKIRTPSNTDIST